MAKKNIYQVYQVAWNEAQRRGRQAALECQPTPMTVVERENPLDDRSPIVKEYPPVIDGVCGFAWVTIRPTTSGFARWLKRNARGHNPYIGYRGELEFSIRDYGQSYEKKMAHAQAMAEYLRSIGIDATASGRLD